MYKYALICYLLREMFSHLNINFSLFICLSVCGSVKKILISPRVVFMHVCMVANDDLKAWVMRHRPYRMVVFEPKKCLAVVLKQ